MCSIRDYEPETLPAVMTFPAEEFEVFVRNYQDMVYTTALRLLKDPAEAQDMAQEAFLKAFDRFEDLKDSPTAGGWLKTVTRNLALNHLERHRNRYKLFSEFATEDGEPDWADPAQPGADAELYERAGTEELELALAALPDAKRIPLVLFHYHDLSYEAIAAKLGASAAKIKTDIFRAREALRRQLTEQK